MRLYAVRHAHAGSRSSWRGDDRERPLSSKGEKQALGIADQLGDRDITRLVSSPSLRCVQTLEPLAAQLGLEVKIDDRLDEGNDAEAALEVADELRDTNAAICTHGDVIPDLLHHLAAAGTRFRDPIQFPKASTWELRWDGKAFKDARYIPPPG
jgi:8-oxo-dGTP diphosphatase